jgi:FMN phosphatase YigB (HAD superfamily)
MDRVVCLFDVDNTLLDHDHVTADLRRHLQAAVGPECAQSYWGYFEQIRSELGYADYLGALQRYRLEHPRAENLMEVSYYLIRYPFANRLLPGSIDAVQHAQEWGPAVILTDGDVVFQPHKIYRSGLLEAFDGKVLLYVHKETELDDIEHRYPAAHYVVIDDKPRILHSIKKQWGSKVTTVFVRQGHYAHDPKALAEYGLADINLERIAEFCSRSLDELLGAGAQRQHG